MSNVRVSPLGLFNLNHYIYFNGWSRFTANYKKSASNEMLSYTPSTQVKMEGLEL